MAKKNTVEIDVKVDDKGTTKKVGVESKKAGKSMDQMGKSAKNTQKGIKGVAQTASAGAKNFSGMARGMGGVVGAYAALAAQMFALTAAFGFFKRAGDLSVLQSGQKAYASATGIAMKTLANDITAATNAQITFKDASQAAAIGTAAGLSAGQLTRLGAAAKDASAILGRDVTDAFNRLVRGVTKAEPELLDELGIILRLDTANKNYADSLGIAVTELTQFQKSQAVANEVLNQSEKKYSAILAVTGGSAVNQFNKLAKSMDDLVMKLQTFLLPAANGFAKALGDIPLVAGMGFALLLTGPLKAMGLGMGGLAESAIAAKAEQQKLYDTIELGAAKAEKAITKLKNKQDTRSKKVGAKGSTAVMGRMQEKGFGALTARDKLQIKKGIKDVEKTYKRHQTITSGIFKGLKAGIVLDMQTGFKQIEAAETALANVDSAVVTKIKLDWATVKVSITTTAAAIGAAASKLMMWAGWVGIAVTVFATLYNMFKTEIPKTAAEIALERQQERIQSLIKEYELLSVTQKALFDQTGGESGASWVAALGNVLSTTDKATTVKLFDDAAKNAEKRKFNKLDEREARVEALLAQKDSMSQREWNTGALSKTRAELAKVQKQLKATNATGGYQWGGGRFDAGLDDNMAPKVISQEEKDAGKFIEDQTAMIKEMNKAAGGAGMSTAMTAYLTTMEKRGKEGFAEKTLEDKDGNNLREQQIQQLLREQSAAVEVGHAYAQMDKLTKESNTSIRAYFKAFAPLSQAENSMTKIAEEIKGLEVVESDSGDVKARKNATKRLAILRKEYKLIEEINSQEHTRTINAMEIAEIQAVSGRIRHKQFKAYIQQGNKAMKAQMSVNEALAEQTTLNKIIGHQTVAKNGGEKTYIDHLGEEQDVSEINTDAQKKQLAIIQKKIDAAKTLLTWEKEQLVVSKHTLANALDTANAKRDQQLLGFEKALMENDKKRLKLQQDRLKLIIQERAESVESTLRTERSNNPFAYMDEAKRTAELKHAAAVANRVEQKLSIEAEVKLKKAMNELEYDLMDIKYTLLDLQMHQTKEEFRLVAAQLRLEAAKTKKEWDPKGYTVGEGYAGAIVEKPVHSAADSLLMRQEAERLEGQITKLDEYGAKVQKISGQLNGTGGLRELAEDGIVKSGVAKLSKIDAVIAKLAEGKDNLQDMKVFTDGMAHSLEENMTSAFTALIQGTASAKQAFGSMAMSILKDISAMIIKMMVFRMISSMFSWGGGGSDAGMTDYVSGYDTASIARYGGVFTNEGKMAQGYATGGVARGSTSGYPATLHGTEAVVPLPNGRSIPVEVKGSGGTNNNIVVNISSDGQSSTKESSGPDMDKMGNAVAMAVQAELQNQKRSGGILNPYGAA